MEFFRQWLIGIISTALILTVFYAIIPEGKLRSIGKLAGSLILLLVLLRPLVQWRPAWDLSYEVYAGQIQRQINDLQEENQKKMETIIAEQIAAYISDKGAQLGIRCRPTVSTRLRDGIPYPDAVTMDVPYQQELADYISHELGIPAERQVWQER